MKGRRFIRTFDKTFKIISNFILFVYVISLLIPVVWMIFTALKSYPEYYQNMFLPPKKIYWQNFSNALDKLVITVVKGKSLVQYEVWDMAFHSVLWALFRPLFGTAILASTAFIIARYRFKFCEFLYALGIFVMIVPLLGSTPSTMVLRRAMGIYDNMFMMIITSEATAFSGFTFMLLYSQFKAIPKAYEEAAMMDGAGRWVILFRIMLPMMLPICTALFVLGFLGSWNDYGTFLVWLPSYPNLAYGIYLFQDDAPHYGATINEIMAGFAIIIVPTVILYILCNKVIVKRFNVGGLKG